MANTLKVGSTGPDVVAWQKILATLPRPTEPWVDVDKVARAWPSTWNWPMVADGSFGKQTQWATESWQASQGLMVDGIVGQASWDKATNTSSSLIIVKGVDMSAVQGVRPDSEWLALKKAGVGFAFLRAIVGNETWSDTTAKGNIDRARAQGIKVGAYNFAYPLPTINPEKQAEDFVRRTLALVGTLDLPLALDCEWPVREQKAADGTLTYPWKKWGCSPAQIQDWILRCLTRGEALTGNPWIIYSFRYWLECIEAAKVPELANRPLWLADYSLAGKIPTGLQAYGIKGEAPWARPTFVQYDGDGGLKLPSGMDADFNFFLGTEEELAALGISGTPIAVLDPNSEIVAAHNPDDAPTDGDIANIRQSLKLAA